MLDETAPPPGWTGWPCVGEASCQSACLGLLVVPETFVIVQASSFVLSGSKGLSVSHGVNHIYRQDAGQWKAGPSVSMSQSV